MYSSNFKSSISFFWNFMRKNPFPAPVFESTTIQLESSCQSILHFLRGFLTILLHLLTLNWLLLSLWQWSQSKFSLIETVASSAQWPLEEELFFLFCLQKSNPTILTKFFEPISQQSFKIQLSGWLDGISSLKNFSIISESFWMKNKTLWQLK